MTQRLRAPVWAAWAALAAAALLGFAPGQGAAPASALVPIASASADEVAVVPEEAYEELAGSAAGVGRDRPGRPVGEPADPEAMVASQPRQRPARPQRPPGVPPGTAATGVPTAAASTAATPGPSTAASPGASPAPDGSASPGTGVNALGTGANDRAADLAAHMLPLGTGLALMGLGLGFIGVRLRRGP
ncbi:hypothetical protein AB0N28_21020 [Streptomyces sp. NPDC051130]|uniref:hypothetical protein n=1 Tax=Streptomyces sp. NPDC051130 TaxID=3157223 RepID=UPI0034374CE6